MTSPAKKSPFTSLDSMVDGLISFTLTPPRVMMASLKLLVPVTVSGRFLISLTKAVLSSLVIALTFFSGSIPDSFIITGINLEGKRPPKIFLKDLLSPSSKSLKTLLSSCSSERAGLRSKKILADLSFS